MFFAHAGEAHVETTQATNLLDSLTHQSVWIALLISVAILLGWFAILNLFKVKLITRLLSLLPVIIALALLFFSHNPIVATILLSVGFIMAFVLTFLMLAPVKK